MRGAIARKQSQSEIATPFGLAMTLFAIPNANYFMLSVVRGEFENVFYHITSRGNPRIFRDKRTSSKLSDKGRRRKVGWEKETNKGDRVPYGKNANRILGVLLMRP